MSSADSRTTSSSSRLSQFGIYRSIDARTEEFLRLSRRRQLRQGCVCAAVSTAITVTIVIVILLIYEYAIVVETSLVQKIRNSNITNETNDKPVADRLDRSFFGFDQDYYERMPLLVNAMQENSYVDPPETTTFIKPKARYILSNNSKTSTSTLKHRISSIRRTSPRPFYYEYKSPTPTPFSKTYTSRSWIDSYRSAQRLKNLQQVIHYLEKTINAKFGDLYALPTSTIAFSGVYVEPPISQPKPTSPTLDLISQAQASNVVEKYQSNHQSSDPLYSYKPDSPGDVNLLADGFFRFSPVPTPNLLRDKYATHIPMFRPIKYRKRNCIGSRCIETAENKLHHSQEASDIKEIESTSHDKPKTFSVMLNLFPLKPKNYEHNSLESLESTLMPINKIYITTSRPTVQFRRKSTTPIRRTTTRIAKPRILPTRKIFKAPEYIPEEKIKPAIIEPKMIVHVNVYPAPEIKDQVTTESNVHTTIATEPPRYSTPIPMLTSTQVEDFHVGSSGIIPPEARLTPAPPPPIPINIPTLPTPTTTSMLPVFDTISSSTEHNFRATNPPEILKFSHEDAKIPEHYKKIMEMEEVSSTSILPGINRRNSKHNVGNTEEYMELRTLTTKLKNDDIESTTQNETTEKTSEGASSTMKTYVPQINGHYRSVNQNSRNINTWLNDNTPENRKRRLEMSVTGFRKTTYVPQYVEINRNNSDKDKEDKE